MTCSYCGADIPGMYCNRSHEFRAWKRDHPDKYRAAQEAKNAKRREWRATHREEARELDRVNKARRTAKKNGIKFENKKQAATRQERRAAIIAKYGVKFAEKTPVESSHCLRAWKVG